MIKPLPPEVEAEIVEVATSEQPYGERHAAIDNILATPQEVTA